MNNGTELTLASELTIESRNEDVSFRPRLADAGDLQNQFDAKYL